MPIPTLNQKLIWCRHFIVFFAIFSSLRDSYVTASTASSNYSSDDELRLLHDVIHSLDPSVRPVRNHSLPIQVYVDYNLINLVKIDSLNQEIVLNIWANFTWKDQIRMWDPKDYGGVKVIHPKPADIWRPKTILTNAVGMSDVFKDYDCPLSIYSNGETHWYPNSVLTFVCSMDFTFFPFDEQNCIADFVSNNDGAEIDFIMATSQISKHFYLVNGEWILKSTSVFTKKHQTSAHESVSVIDVNVVYQRRPMFYVITVLFPIIGLSFLSLFGFIVPRDSGERTSYGMTVLLSLTVFMGIVSSLLPANSDTFPYMTMYIFGLLCLNILAVVIIICQLRISAKQQQVPDTKNTDEGKTCPGVGCRTKMSKNENSLTPTTTQTQHASRGHDNDMISNLLAWDPNQVNLQNRPSNITECRHENTTLGCFRGSIDNEDPSVNKGNGGSRRGDEIGENKEKNRRNWKKLLQEKEDYILFTTFAILLFIFSSIFASMFVAHVYRIEYEE